MKRIILLSLAAALALTSCKTAPPVATVSRSMNGTTTTTYHDPNSGFHKALEGFFTP